MKGQHRPLAPPPPLLSRQEEQPALQEALWSELRAEGWRGPDHPGPGGHAQEGPGRILGAAGSPAELYKGRIGAGPPRPREQASASRGRQSLGTEPLNSAEPSCVPISWAGEGKARPCRAGGDSEPQGGGASAPTHPPERGRENPRPPSAGEAEQGRWSGRRERRAHALGSPRGGQSRPPPGVAAPPARFTQEKLGFQGPRRRRARESPGNARSPPQG